MGNPDWLLDVNQEHLQQDAPFGALYLFFNYFSKAGNSPVLYIQKKNKKKTLLILYNAFVSNQVSRLIISWRC
jgi:hypothetical protein